MGFETVTLESDRVKLEPMTRDHLEALAEAGKYEELWRFTNAKADSREAMSAYMETAVAEAERGIAMRDYRQGVIDSRGEYALSWHRSGESQSRDWLDVDHSVVSAKLRQLRGEVLDASAGVRCVGLRARRDQDRCSQ